MAKYSVDWKKLEDKNYDHTAATKYESDDFVIWKGKYRVFSVIYSADQWHLERLSDHRIMHSCRTAKECMGVLEYEIRRGTNINDPDMISFLCPNGVKFNDDFSRCYY